MQSAIPLSRGGEPLFRQVYGGIRQAILSGAFAPGSGCHRRAIWPSNSGFPEPWCCWPMSTCWRRDLSTGARRFGDVRRRQGWRGTPRPGRATGACAPVTLWKNSKRYRWRPWIRHCPCQSPRATTSSMAEATWPHFPSQSGGACCCGRQGRGRSRQFDYGTALGNADLRAAICAHLRRVAGGGVRARTK